MKGVIMAGGKGTRLRPLTCNVPKPMVPLIEKPVMQYSIELLKKHGITDIAVTVQYLPDTIRDYFGDGSSFGVNLTYFEETTPLGTAGSVKQAEAFLDEPFIVVSGDALTDFDLQAGVDFHQQKDGLVTIFMKQVDNPLEFGVIMTDDQQEIIRFLEKPNWSEVFSDTVNTGIYIMEPSIFKYIKENTVTDFSKDVFPTLLEKKAGLYGYAASGYWSDIGNLKQYRQAHFDLLNRELEATIEGIEVEPGVWLGDNVIIEEGARIEGPLAIGSNSIVRAGAYVGPQTVIGSSTTISHRASLKRSVLWNGAYIGDDSELRGATLCQNVTVGAKAELYEDVVIGHHTIVGEEATIQPNIKVWPHKNIEADTTIYQSIVWNDSSQAQPVLKGHRATGIANVEMNPEQAAKLGAAYGSILDQGSTVYVASDRHAFSKLMRMSLVQSLQATGVHVVEIGETMLPILRYSIELEECQGGIYLRLSDRNQEKQMIVEFFDEKGLPITSGTQREIEQTLSFQSYRRVAFDYVGNYSLRTDLEEEYTSLLLAQVNVDLIKERKWKVALHDETKGQLSYLPLLLQSLGCEVRRIPHQVDIDKLKSYLIEAQMDLGIMIGDSGEFVSWMTEKGHLVTEEEQLLSTIQMQLDKKLRTKLAIPLYGGNALEEVAVGYDATLVRTKASTRSMMETEGTVQMMTYDAPFAIVHMLDYLTTHAYSLSALIEKLPDEAIYKEEVQCKTELKGLVMRKLMELLKGKQVELNDGMKVRHQEGGWTFIVPDQVQPTFTVYAQARDGNGAKQLAGEYIEQINSIKRHTS
ncbi:sugar phosphate nucleotidyltransferase [Halalkalibacter nanhaiisediminis]|uniref:Mannose-1-phosphate guanylyltransferase/phosphomannomutase n=1 Tax=Halalkalibacter nanhaiisediminis TaxID=688079 RepID=A0A562QNN7_9BACI|nr:sugar phosphate nucleotidyltransferase [Halalkalibacter nanhaiisediminis]TWI57810.1 mannose-1-phosphate guanylyltransferase/phosphomannomutase [Halalkalibacter nanhaiisediminis]